MQRVTIFITTEEKITKINKHTKKANAKEKRWNEK